MSKTTQNLGTTTNLVPLTTAEQKDIKGGLIAHTCEEKRPRIRR